MTHRSGLSWILLPLLLAFGAGACAAQDLASIAAPAKQGGAETIAIGDIPATADSDERFAQEVLLLAGQSMPINQLEPRLEAITTSVREKSRLYKLPDLRLLPVLRLESLQRQWKFDARQFAG